MSRWWGIRHVRFIIASFFFWRWWNSEGKTLGFVPNPSDLEYLEKIKRGEA